MVNKVLYTVFTYSLLADVIPEVKKRAKLPTFCSKMVLWVNKGIFLRSGDINAVEITVFETRNYSGLQL